MENVPPQTNTDQPTGEQLVNGCSQVSDLAIIPCLSPSCSQDVNFFHQRGWEDHRDGKGVHLNPFRNLTLQPHGIECKAAWFAGWQHYRAGKKL